MQKLRIRSVILVLILAALFIGVGAQNPWNGKVVLQAFWWNYWNNNYPNGWYNYLAELAPRLRDMGIDAVWVPPSIKNAGTNSVGYGPFDQYDLGDKYQKGSLRTRLGTKDEYLRMVAVMHANGIDVIQDVVFNHNSDAGSADGSGGQDPSAYDNKWKNFRYACYSTPASAETAANYLARQGRWSKNWQDFHPNPAHNSNSGDWCSEMFGPDICYYQGAYGISSNATYNPAQTQNYMRNQARTWAIWMKKQTGVDGFRLDAVKNFEDFAAEDFLYNLQYNAGWASGGAQMFAVGEYVGGSSELDGWCNTVQNRAGTFDFNLRGAVYGVVYGMGNYNLADIPGAQQGNRTRTVPFVNNHDSFRPKLDASGNIVGWYDGVLNPGEPNPEGYTDPNRERQELVPHIDPAEPRLAAAYAIACAVDGSPEIFFEDLFNIASTGKRMTHLPTSTTNLPVRDAISNIIWCHQKLSFKAGAYKVRWQAADLLIIERGARAVIGVNDNWNQWQYATVATDFAQGTWLHDYSGANSNDIQVGAGGSATIWVPPCDGSNVRRGYTIWGPAGITGGFSPAQRSTTQEWEMANDLGDSHASSLKQGGALPASSAALRTVGRIFAEGGKSVTAVLTPENSAKNLKMTIYSNSGSILKSVNGYGTLTLTYTPASTGFYILKACNYYSTNPAQKVWVKATYTSPKVVNTALYPAKRTVGKDSGSDEDSGEPAAVEDEFDLDIASYVNIPGQSRIVEFTLPRPVTARLEVFDPYGELVAVPLEDEELGKGMHSRLLDFTGWEPGTYTVRLRTDFGDVSTRIVVTQPPARREIDGEFELNR